MKNLRQDITISHDKHGSSCEVYTVDILAELILGLLAYTSQPVSNRTG